MKVSNLKIENYLYSFKVNSRELNLRVLPLSVVNTLSGKNKYFNDELQAIKKYKVGLNPKEEYKLSINDAYILVRRAEQFIKNIETESADDIISITNWRDEVLKNIASVKKALAKNDRERIGHELGNLKQSRIALSSSLTTVFY